MKRSCIWALALCLGSTAASGSYEESVEGQLLADLADPEEAEAVATDHGLEMVRIAGSIGLFQGPEEAIEESLENMESDARVLFAERNARKQTPEAIRQMVLAAIGGTVDDFHDQEVSARIGVEQAHTVSQGSGVRVALLDTGVDPTHELFAQNVVWGPDLVDDDDEPWEESDGLDADEDGIVDEGFGHGSMVAGLVRLVAPEAELLVTRIMDDEGRTDAFRVVQGIHWAVDNGADVINLSLGSYRTISSIGKAIDYAEDNGVIVVSGAGNDDRPSPSLFPASHSWAVMVASVGPMDEKADFSDYSTKVSLVAPGVGLRSAYPGGWALGSGCSFATPLVSGEVALILSHNPGVSEEDIFSALTAGTISVDHIPGNEPYLGRLGDGRIYIPGALGMDTSSIEPAEPRRLVKVFPQPARERVTFRAQEEALVEIEVVDASGRQLFRSGPAREVTWSFGDSDRATPQGVFYYRVIQDGQVMETAPFVHVR